MSDRSASAASRQYDRGQTTLDFAIGVSVFLLAVSFIVLFVPTMFDPFSLGDGAGPVVAERSATHLADGLLVADPGTPGTLDAGCTIAFFTANSTAATNEDCRVVPTDSLARDVGAISAEEATDEDIPQRWRVNASVQALNESNGVAVRADDVQSGYGTDRLVRGPDSRGNNADTYSKVVTVDEDRYRIVVRVWS